MSAPFRVRECLGPDEILWLVVEREQADGGREIYASGSATPGFEPVMRRVYTLMAAALNGDVDELDRLTRDCGGA